jgi:uncharacterized membrane protein
VCANIALLLCYKVIHLHLVAVALLLSATVYMPSKILIKDAHILLENHKCETCPDLLAILKPYKVASNAEYQQRWYQKNKEKCAEYYESRYSKSEYQESQKNLHKNTISDKSLID